MMQLTLKPLNLAFKYLHKDDEEVRVFVDILTGFEIFQALRQSLKEELKWRSAGPVRDAVALAALPMAVRSPIDFAALKDAARILKENHSRLYFLRSATRYAIAATLLASERDPIAFTHQIAAGRSAWKETGLRRVSPYEGASLMTLLLCGNNSIDPGVLSALKSAFDHLNKEYYWDVGSYSLPALTLALQFDGTAAANGAQVFEELKALKFPPRFRMSTALISSIGNRSPRDAASWMSDCHKALKANKLGTAAQRTTSIALASLLDINPGDYAAQVKTYKQKFKDGPFKVTDAGVLALNLVNTIRVMNVETIGKSDNMTNLAAIISALQAYIAMQEQAAVVAAIAGGAVAATAAT